MNKLKVVIVAIALLASTVAHAGYQAGNVEHSIIFNNGIAHQVAAAYEYDFRKGVGLSAFASKVGDYNNVLVGVAVSPVAGVCFNPSIGFDQSYGMTKSRWGMTVIGILPLNMSQVVILEHGGSGTYIKSLTTATLNEQVGLTWRAEKGKGWGPQLDLKVHQNWTVSMTSMYGLTDHPVNLLSFKFQK